MKAPWRGRDGRRSPGSGPIRVSIITPTFNSEAAIERNVRSVLSQRYLYKEQVFIDKCSTDRTHAIVTNLYHGDTDRGGTRRSAAASQEVHRFISGPDQGIADAFNMGIQAATGDIVAILNSDDYFARDDALEIVASIFVDNDIEFAYGDILFVDPVHGTNRRRPLCCPLTRGMPYYHPAVFVRRTLYDRVGLFCLDYRYCMDFEWVCRLYRTRKDLNVAGAYIELGSVSAPAVSSLMTPLVVMSSGGASTVHEMEAVDEIVVALKAHGFWSLEAAIFQNGRRTRIVLKRLLTVAKLNWIVRMWRNMRNR